MSSIDHRGDNVKVKAGSMRKRKVTDSSLLLKIRKTWPEELCFRAVCEIVMREHSPFRHPCCSRCIDQGAALLGGCFSGSLFNSGIFNFIPQIKEIFPAHDFFSIVINFSIVIINNDSLYFSIIQQIKIFFCDLYIFSNY